MLVLRVPCAKSEVLKIVIRIEPKKAHQRTLPAHTEIKAHKLLSSVLVYYGFN